MLLVRNRKLYKTICNHIICKTIIPKLYSHCMVHIWFIFYIQEVRDAPGGLYMVRE